MTTFDKAWGIVKDDSFEESFPGELPPLKRSEPCYACHMDETPERCEGAKWSYHGGAGGLFTYCEPQMKRIVQETKDDPSLEPGDSEYGSWTDDLQEM